MMKAKKYLNKTTFWDCTINDLDLENDKNFIIARIAERGTDPEVDFMVQFYAKKDILFVVNNFKEISPKTKNYFNTIVF